MAFYTIFVPSGLSPADYRRAARSGPSAVTSRRREQADLVRSAGFEEVREVDVTAEFLATTKSWLEWRERYAAELRAADGDAAFEERQHDSRVQARAIEDGLLRRALFVARRPA
jgi:hypothetical protein